MSALALALHGGCGTLPKEDLPPEEWAEAKRHIADALRAGWTILAQGGTAVEATVVALEDSPHFNAGHGAALNTDSERELDAAMMEGAALRAGDSPIIDAGTYARNGVCAVSGTGKGEFFIRHVAGHEVASLIAYEGLSLAEATRTVVFDRIGSHGIGAGIVAVDAGGNIAAPFNTLGMHRGWVLPSGELHVATHGEVACVAHLSGSGT